MKLRNATLTAKASETHTNIMQVLVERESHIYMHAHVKKGDRTDSESERMYPGTPIGVVHSLEGRTSFLNTLIRRKPKCVAVSQGS